MKQALNLLRNSKWFATRGKSVSENLLKMDCAEVFHLSDDELYYATEVLINSPNHTPNDTSTSALVKIVECLDSERLITKYWPDFGKRIIIKARGIDGQRLRNCMHDDALFENTRIQTLTKDQKNNSTNISYQLEQQRKLIEAKDRLVRNKVRGRRNRYTNSLKLVADT